MTAQITITPAQLGTLDRQAHALLTLLPPVAPITGASLWSPALKALRPGAHAVVLADRKDAAAHMIGLRLGGFEIRDVIEYHGPERYAAILARRPVEGTVVANLSKWGTGVINVDATRLPPDAATPRTDTEQDPGVGRWPANVVLSPSSDVPDSVARFFLRVSLADAVRYLFKLIVPPGGVLLDPFQPHDGPVGVLATDAGLSLVGVSK